MKNTNNCLLTICVLAFNVEKYLSETLDSVLLPDLAGRYEVIIVNDGSTDRSPDIAHAYASGYPSVFRVIDKKNGGMGSGINAGIRNARGVFFKQLDGDDLLDTGNLRELVLSLREDSSDLVFAPFTSFDDRNGTVVKRYEYPEIAEHAGEKDFGKQIQYFPFLEMHAVCIRTEIFRKYGIELMEHCFYVDVEYMVKACSHVRTMTYFPKEIYRYRVFRAGQSMSEEGLKKHYREHARVCLELAEYVRHMQSPEEISRALSDRVIRMIEFQYGIFLLMKISRKTKSELMIFDRNLKRLNPDLYNRLPSRVIILLRSSRFVLYPVLALRRQQNQRKTADHGQ